jgi:outer membrane protein assembly factor BamB
MSLAHRWLVVCAVVPALAADWPQFLGPQRNGISSETGLLAEWPKKGPPVAWERAVGDGYSGPVIAGGKLVLFHGVGGDEVIEGLDAASGKGLWKSAYACGYTDTYGKGDGPRSTSLVVDGHVYTLGALGHLTCLELDTGRKVWQRALLEDYQASKGFFGVATSPILEGDHLLVNVGGKGAGIVALNKDTGKEAWKATDCGASYSSPVAATIDGVRHALFFTRQGLVSLDPATGAERFSHPWRARINESVNAAAPVVGGDQVFVSSSYGTGALLVRVRKDGCDEVWKGDGALSCHYNTPVLRDGYLYGIDGRQEPGATRLVCVEWKTGKVRWARDRFGCASMIWADSKLILLTETGELVVADVGPDGYREKARATVLNGPCRAEIALANGRLYARDGRKLVCFNLTK